MRTIGIVTDSHSGISQKLARQLEIEVIPMPFYFGDTCYYEDVSLSREEFFARLKNGADVSTSQPSPAAVLDAIDLVEAGYSAAECREILERVKAKMNIYVAVSDLTYLRRGGRISGSTAAIGSLLNIKPILCFDIGKPGKYGC